MARDRLTVLRATAYGALAVSSADDRRSLSAGAWIVCLRGDSVAVDPSLAR